MKQTLVSVRNLFLASSSTRELDNVTCSCSVVVEVMEIILGLLKSALQLAIQMVSNNNNFCVLLRIQTIQIVRHC